MWGVSLFDAQFPRPDYNAMKESMFPFNSGEPAAFCNMNDEATSLFHLLHLCQNLMYPSHS